MPSRNAVTAVDVTDITYAHPNFAGIQMQIIQILKHVYINKSSAS